MMTTGPSQTMFGRAVQFGNMQQNQNPTATAQQQPTMTQPQFSGIKDKFEKKDDAQYYSEQADSVLNKGFQKANQIKKAAIKDATTLNTEATALGGEIETLFNIIEEKMIEAGVKVEDAENIIKQAKTDSEDVLKQAQEESEKLREKARAAANNNNLDLLLEKINNSKNQFAQLKNRLGNSIKSVEEQEQNDN